jgi:AcrR family transcriptional regulator
MRVAHTRTPNRRGEGARLRGEIVAAARRLLERSGNEDALTLRAVAREAGIAAPSIYGHFADREQILEAVVGQVFGELEDAVRSAAEAEPDPDQRLEAVCRAYLSFAEDQPAGYRVLFGRSRASTAEEEPREMSDLAGAGAFGVLAEAVAAARSEDGPPPGADGPPPGADGPGRPGVLTDATALWVALHGYAALRAGVPVFPWPQDLLPVLVHRLIRSPDGG